jgi:hypothetical protein
MAITKRQQRYQTLATCRDFDLQVAPHESEAAK